MKMKGEGNIYQALLKIMESKINQIKEKMNGEGSKNNAICKEDNLDIVHYTCDYLLCK
ncbi:MAG: hypothetical protein HFJ08_15105 [Lachnospiraceae bacterium]|nr:hypothetical protein [Lachnospiraceae bacterium]